MKPWRSIVLLSGGVGGARLLHGLSRVLPALSEKGAEALTCIVNTGDDFEHWGLNISPDLDTCMYTLSDLAHEERGWGLAKESFGALEMMRAYGEDTWFQLGDRDLGTHITRTRALRSGETLTQVTARMCKGLGITCRVLPMSDMSCRTMIDTEGEGTLPFQTWFVRHLAKPKVKAVRFEGDAKAAPGLIDAINDAELVIIGPSNPYVSIDPIFSLPGVRDAVMARPLVALSPILGGQAVKGPLGSMIPDLTGRDPSAGAIALHYGAPLRGIVVETGDEASVRNVHSARILATQTLMKSRADSARLATEILAFAESLS